MKNVVIIHSCELMTVEGTKLVNFMINRWTIHMLGFNVLPVNH